MEWFALMQHYGSPTRLQDWTYSFFVALYFAVEKVHFLDKDEKTCAIWAFNTKSEYNKIKGEFGEEGLKRFIEEDRNARVPGTFKEFFMNNTPKAFVCPMNPFNSNIRLNIQQGVFLCPGDISKPFQENIEKTFDDDDKLKENLRKYEITVTPVIRNKIILYLIRMNMNTATLFPGFEGFSKSMQFVLAFEAVKDKLPGEEKYVIENLYKPGINNGS